MKIFKGIKNLILSTKDSFKRFPITLIISTSLALLLIIINENSDWGFERLEYLRRLAFVLALGIPISLCIKLISEKWLNNNRGKEYILYFAGLIALVLYYFFLFKDFQMVSITRYIGISIFLYLTFLYLPYLNIKENYEFYINKLFFNFFLTYLYSMVLYLGIIAIIATINSLFDANIDVKYFYYTFLIIGLIFAPSMFLAKIPLVDEDLTDSVYPRYLRILLLYIVIPLITVYSIILYVYFGRIIITQIWPRGLVSHLVLWYSVLSIGVIFLITPIVDEDKWAKIFRRYFPIFITPILIMMFVSIGLRINQYGITEPRYFGLLLGIWVSAMMVYFIVRKKLWNVFIPLTLSLLALIAVLGPLSGYSISKYSQNKRLEGILVRNNMLVNKEIVQNPNIDLEDKREISNILSYFNINHSLEDVNNLNKDFKLSQMKDVFGFEKFEEHSFARHFYLTLEDNNLFDIEGYNYYINLIRTNTITLEDENIIISTTVDNKLIIERNNERIYENDLFKIAKEIVANDFEENSAKYSYSLDDGTFIDENDNIRIKIIVFNLSGTFINSDEINIDHVEPHIMIRIIN